MPLRIFLRYLLNNEQLIQRMADSYPIRKAARLAVSIMYQAKGAADKHNLPTERIKKIIQTFKNWKFKID